MATIETTSKAYVLHIKPLKETQIVVYFLTEKWGKLSLFIPIKNKHKISHQSQLLLFRPLLLTTKYHINRYTFIRVETPTLPFYFSIELQFSGLYLNELCYYLLLENEPIPELFTTYHAILFKFSEKHISSLLRQFELRLYITLGLLNHLLLDHQQQPIKAEYRYIWLASEGFIPTKNNGCILGKYLIEWYHDNLHSDMSVKQIKFFSKMILQQALGHKKLKVYQLYKQYRSMTT